MTLERVNKLYKPDELQAAVIAFTLCSPFEEQQAVDVLKNLHALGWRLVKVP